MDKEIKRYEDFRYPGFRNQNNSVFRKGIHFLGIALFEEIAMALAPFLVTLRKCGETFGRSYGGVVEAYKCDDAEAILITLGSVAGTTRCVVDELREQGKKVGLLKIRCMRPFPAKEIVEIVKNAKFVGVLEKDVSFGFEGVVYTDVSSALKSAGVEIPAANYVGGLGGRSIYKTDIEKIYEELLAGTAKVGEASFVNLRRDICGA